VKRRLPCCVLVRLNCEKRASSVKHTVLLGYTQMNINKVPITSLHLIVFLSYRYDLYCRFTFTDSIPISHKQIYFGCLLNHPYTYKRSCSRHKEELEVFNAGRLKAINFNTAKRHWKQMLRV